MKPVLICRERAAYRQALSSARREKTTGGARKTVQFFADSKNMSNFAAQTE